MRTISDVAFMSACAAEADACCSTITTSIKDSLIVCPLLVLPITFVYPPVGNGPPCVCLFVNEVCFLGYGCAGFRFGLAGGISDAVVFLPVDILDVLFTVPCARLSPLAKLLNNSASSSSFEFPVTSLLLFFPINACINSVELLFPLNFFAASGSFTFATVVTFIEGPSPLVCVSLVVAPSSVFVFPPPLVTSDIWSASRLF